MSSCIRCNGRGYNRAYGCFLCFSNARDKCYRCGSKNVSYSVNLCKSCSTSSDYKCIKCGRNGSIELRQCGNCSRRTNETVSEFGQRHVQSIKHMMNMRKKLLKKL